MLVLILVPLWEPALTATWKWDNSVPWTLRWTCCQSGRDWASWMMASFNGLLIVASGCERKTRMIFSKKPLRSLFGVLGDDVLVPGRMWVVWRWYYQNFTSVLVLFFFTWFLLRVLIPINRNKKSSKGPCGFLEWNVEPNCVLTQ